jgi:hypothetical protein
VQVLVQVRVQVLVQVLGHQVQGLRLLQVRLAQRAELLRLLPL